MFLFVCLLAFLHCGSGGKMSYLSIHDWLHESTAFPFMVRTRRAVGGSVGGVLYGEILFHVRSVRDEFREDGCTESLINPNIFLRTEKMSFPRTDFYRKNLKYMLVDEAPDQVFVSSLCFPQPDERLLHQISAPSSCDLRLQLLYSASATEAQAPSDSDGSQLPSTSVTSAHVRWFWLQHRGPETSQTCRRRQSRPPQLKEA